MPVQGRLCSADSSNLPIVWNVWQDEQAMQIQDVPPRGFEPLATLDDDYERAVLLLAWASFPSPAAPRLLFVMVELLPIEVPPPLDDGVHVEQIGAHSSVHVRRLVVSAREAIAWYLQCRQGIALVPSEDGSFPSGNDVHAQRFVLADLGEEPPWPTLVCVHDENEQSTIPFCPPWHGTPRVHHLLPVQDLVLEKLWPHAEERDHVVGWLSGQLHFHLDDYPEYWGSLHLVAPNPVFRRIQERLFVTADPPSESVFVHFEPRTGKTVEGLELVYRESHPWGTRDLRRVVLHGSLVRVGFDHTLDTAQRMVLDPQRGMLEEEGGNRIFLGKHANFPKVPSVLRRLWEGRNRREKRRSSTGESTT